jgi:Co/Zn/Cd efflux system component
MFVVESIASKTSGSMSLQADALDFLGDSFNYGISLYVINHSLKTRATVSFLKGLTMAGFGVFILVETILKIRNGGLPEPPTMGMVGSLALAVNLGVALILYKFREGDSNMQSVWLCTRNDAIGNVMVLIAAWLVLWTRTGWPDWIAGLTLASLGFASGIRVIRLSRKEIEFNEPSEGNCC